MECSEPSGQERSFTLGTAQGFLVSGGPGGSFQKWVPSGPEPQWRPKKGPPRSSSHCCFPLSVNFLLLPLHLAEAVEATEAGEGELGHALGQAGGTLTREDLQGEAGEEEGQEEGEREKQAGVNIPRALQIWPVTATP